MTEEELLQAMQEAHEAAQKLEPSDPGYAEAVSAVRRAFDAYTAHLDAEEMKPYGFAGMSAVFQKDEGVLQTGDMVMVAGMGLGTLEMVSEEGHALIHLINGATLECRLPGKLREVEEEDTSESTTLH